MSRARNGAGAVNGAGHEVAGPHRWESPVCAEVDPELFFPPVETPAACEAAKAICARCPLLARCRAYVTAHPQPAGVWGGLSTPERDQARAVSFRSKTRSSR